MCFYCFYNISCAFSYHLLVSFRKSKTNNAYGPRNYEHGDLNYFYMQCFDLHLNYYLCMQCFIELLLIRSASCAWTRTWIILHSVRHMSWTVAWIMLNLYSVLTKSAISLFLLLFNLGSDFILISSWFCLFFFIIIIHNPYETPFFVVMYDRLPVLSTLVDLEAR